VVNENKNLLLYLSRSILCCLVIHSCSSVCVCCCWLYRPIEIPFGDRDQVGDYTLRVDDIVEFNIATDRRDKLQRATNIGLSEHTFFVSKEQREKVRVKNN